MADWRSEEFYKERRDELEKRVGPRRFKHSLGVSETAEELARIYGADETVVFPAGHTECGPVMKKLRETLTGIQDGAVEDKHNWVFKVC